MKNLNINPIYVVVAILALVAFRSPEDQRIVNSTERIITVTGSADMLVSPDEITIDISYQEYWNSKYHKSKKNITQIEEGIVSAINEAGIKTDNITINDSYAWKHNWNYWHYWYNYYGHLAQKNLSVKVKSANDLNKIIANIKKKSIRQEGIINIQLNGSSNKKIQEYRILVKERAMQAAQEKADYLLKAVGQKRGVVVTIQELDDSKKTKTTTTQGGYYHPFYGYGWGGYRGSVATNNGGMNAISNSSVSMPSSGGSPVAAGDQDLSMKPIKLRYEIQAQFTIVPM